MTRIGNSDLDVSPLNLGGNVFGWTAGEEQSEAVLDAYVSGGGNFIDTADMYGRGESERIIGSWMRKRGNRDRLVVTTKVSNHPDFMGLAQDNVLAAADASLARLGTDYIDLYLAHVDDESVPLEETVAAFDKLVRHGKVRYVGLSNYSAVRINQWVDIAEAEGFALPVALQPHYSLAARQLYERELAPVVTRHQLGVTPYFALAAGFLTGKYRTRESIIGTARENMLRPFATDDAFGIVNALEKISQAHGVAIATVALAWLLAQPAVVAPIASARRVDQLPHLLAAGSLSLTEDDLSVLDAASLKHGA